MFGTLILAGSILEAVLIDWLTEIKGEDYFKKDYMITDRNGRSKRADLIDYINEIKEIEESIDTMKNEVIYHSELAKSYAVGNGNFKDLTI